MVSSPRRFSLLGLGVVLVAWLCVTGLGRRTATDFRVRAGAASTQLDSAVTSSPDSVRGLVQAYLERARVPADSSQLLVTAFGRRTL